MAPRWQSLSPVWNQLQQLQGAPLWGQLQNLHQEMNRLFDRWGGEPGGAAGGAVYPAINAWEDADGLRLEAELPGVEQSKLEIYVTGGNQLTIKGERRGSASDKGVCHRQERGAGIFARTLTLPFDVDENRVEARLENGVLCLMLPKQEAAKPRKISVKAQ